MKTERDRAIAIAGVYQAAKLASRIARQGIAESSAVEASIHSLFQINAASVEAVYGGTSGVTTGLITLLNQLTNGREKEGEVTRYVITLLHLERKLSKNSAMAESISQGIEQATGRLEHYHLLHTNIIAQLADIYANTISTLKPRVMIQGEPLPLHLQNQENVNRIRALLLAGIRSAMLWRQCGGGRLQILLGRKRLQREIEDILSNK
ncbi:MAG: high frequency lysogenization protein HflD [Candidatus Sedimenticola sp. (ex Thyasira tokunagai)]